MALEVAETQTRLRRDLAERARVQHALENSETRLQQILNNSTAVVFVKDTEGRFLFVNRQFERLFHCRQAEVAGKTDGEILPADIAHGISRQRFAGTAAQYAYGIRGDRAAGRWLAYLHLDQIPVA
jgi:PAS domain S-box-containing protein